MLTPPPQLCLFQPILSSDGLSISVFFTPTPNATSVTIPLEPALTPAMKSYEISIFNSTTTGYDMGPEPALFFSTHLGYPVRLVYIGRNQRTIHPAIAPPTPTDTPHPQSIAFADAAPILLSTRASLDDIAARQGGHFDLTKFRPNIFVDTLDSTAPFDEEFWAQVEVGEAPVKLEMTFNTVRCQSINVDYDTGRLMPSEQQVYKKMTKDRRINPFFPFRPCFGRYAFCEQFGRSLVSGYVRRKANWE